MLERFIKILQLFSDGQTVHPSTQIGELNQLDFITCVLILQGMYSVDVPEGLCSDYGRTIGEFVNEVGKLPKVEDELFFAKTVKVYADLLGHRAGRGCETIH